jgi:hypothetical protein
MAWHSGWKTQIRQRLPRFEPISASWSRMSRPMRAGGRPYSEGMN